MRFVTTAAVVLFGCALVGCVAQADYDQLMVLNKSLGSEKEARDLLSTMAGALVSLAVAGIAISANLQSVVPSFLQSAYRNMPIFGGVLVGITLIGFVVGWVVGKRGLR